MVDSVNGTPRLRRAGRFDFTAARIHASHADGSEDDWECQCLIPQVYRQVEMRFVHQHTLAQQRGLQVRNIRTQRVLLIGTTAVVVVKKSGKSGFASFAIVFNARDDHDGLPAAGGHVTRKVVREFEGIGPSDVPNVIKCSPPPSPRRRGPCPPVLLWRCRPPSRPRPPATQRATAASPTASDSLLHPAAPGRVARARS